MYSENHIASIVIDNAIMLALFVQVSIQWMFLGS